MIGDRVVTSFVFLLDWIPVLALTWLSVKARHRRWLLLVCGYLFIGACYASYAAVVTLLPAGVMAAPAPWSPGQVVATLALFLVAAVAWPLFMLLSPFV